MTLLKRPWERVSGPVIASFIPFRHRPCVPCVSYWGRLGVLRRNRGHMSGFMGPIRPHALKQGGLFI